MLLGSAEGQIWRAEAIVIRERAQPGKSFNMPAKTPNVVNVLYLAHCTREKGLFDTMKGVALASQRLAERRFCRVVAAAGGGKRFVTAEEKEEFDRLAAREDMKTNRAVFWFRFGRAEKQVVAGGGSVFVFRPITKTKISR